MVMINTDFQVVQRAGKHAVRIICQDVTNDYGPPIGITSNASLLEHRKAAGKCAISERIGPLQHRNSLGQKPSHH